MQPQLSILSIYWWGHVKRSNLKQLQQVEERTFRVPQSILIVTEYVLQNLKQTHICIYMYVCTHQQN